LARYSITGNFTGNLAEIGRFAIFLRPNTLAISVPSIEIPYATEQGIFASLTGNFFAITGKSREFTQTNFHAMKVADPDQPDRLPLLEYEPTQAHTVAMTPAEETTVMEPFPDKIK
jgi:hypothetical protein